jgi:hypothetical protein
MSHGGRGYETMHSRLVARYFAIFFRPCRGPADRSFNAIGHETLVSTAEMDRVR